MLRRLVVLALIAAVVGFGVFWVVTIPATVPASALAPHTPNLDNGKTMFLIGGCASCHATPGQDDKTKLGGGVGLKSPFGTFYTPNISPDPNQGIGKWTEADFVTAMVNGTSPDGRHYFPAFPYTSYQRIGTGDLRDLFAYLKTLPAVQDKSKPHDVPFPFNIRRTLGGWKFLFLDGKPFEGDPTEDAAWNRGAYLVEGLGHCGACHTPRGWVLQEKALDDGGSAYLQGAELDAWSAPNLRGDLRTGLGGWSQDDIVTFLKSGHNDKGVAFGSMLDVVNNSTPYLSDEDIRAMAAFIKSLPATESEAQFVYDDAATKMLEAGKPQQPGAAIYLGSCAACHGMDGKGQAPFIPPLAGNPAVLDANSSSLINLVLNGADPLVVKGVPDAYRMPQFRIQLNDESIGQVLSFVRGAWGNGATAVTTEQVAKLRPVTDPSSDRVIVLKMR
jgi:alcohol dehydrogenase (quinone), cytochrome c subunit